MDRFKERFCKAEKKTGKDEEKIERVEKNQINFENTLPKVHKKFDNLKA